MFENCLNCKYEPDWQKWKHPGEYERCFGECKWNKKLPVFPEVFQYHKKGIIRYKEDDSGIMRNCKAWEARY